MKIKGVGSYSAFPRLLEYYLIYIYIYIERERERKIDGKSRGNRKLQANHGNNTTLVKEKIFFILFEIFVQTIIIIL
jgi:hypothetical protein